MRKVQTKKTKLKRTQIRDSFLNRWSLSQYFEFTSKMDFSSTIKHFGRVGATGHHMSDGIYEYAIHTTNKGFPLILEGMIRNSDDLILVNGKVRFAFSGILIMTFLFILCGISPPLSYFRIIRPEALTGEAILAFVPLIVCLAVYSMVIRQRNQYTCHVIELLKFENKQKRT